MTINEVSKKMNMTADTLRFYEKSGLIGPIRRSKSGYRDYTKEDLKKIEFVKCMRKAELSIEVLKKYMELYTKGNKTKEERKMLLVEQKENLDKKINEMKEASKRLEYKIQLYNEGKLEEYLKDNK